MTSFTYPVRTSESGWDRGPTANVFSSGVTVAGPPTGLVPTNKVWIAITPSTIAVGTGL